MKLKKGSLEAKKFMAKIRAKKGASKKISGVKKPSVKKTHTDIKSHNYKISISGMNKKTFDNFIERIKFERNIESFINDLKKQLTNKSLNRIEKAKIKKDILTSKKHKFSNHKIILTLKKLL
jgi:hypothetical protein